MSLESKSPCHSLMATALKEAAHSSMPVYKMQTIRASHRPEFDYGLSLITAMVNKSPL